ncbi:MAG: hypothetical protein IT428_07090 [Planctomycetaceae bacterium]|nr:hypothetical protein [Planctomycetaceae bacterium]
MPTVAFDFHSESHWFFDPRHRCRSLMRNLPFRTNRTWLTDAHLVLLDILFEGNTWAGLLREEVFHDQWNLPYSHGLSDDELDHQLRVLCQHGVLETARSQHPRLGSTVFCLTDSGFALWSDERSPQWNRYCTCRQKTTSAGRILLTVLAGSPQVRDDVFRLKPFNVVRSRTFEMPDPGIIPWRSFETLFAGMVIYSEPSYPTPAGYNEWRIRHERHRARLKEGRTWWSTVDELQRFIAAH